MIILDTDTLLNLVAQQENLSPVAIKIISKNAGRIFVSAASAISIGEDVNKKLIELPYAPAIWIQKAIELHGLTELPISAKIAMLATQLPQLHNDLVDRLIIASAMVHDLDIVTANKKIQQYPDISWVW